jgi:hypothetical protein
VVPVKACGKIVRITLSARLDVSIRGASSDRSSYLASPEVVARGGLPIGLGMPLFALMHTAQT